MGTKRTPSRAPEQWAQRILARVEKQRDGLLSELESLVISGNLGWNKGDTYAEIHIDHIRKADRYCKRVRSSIAKATQETPDEHR